MKTAINNISYGLYVASSRFQNKASGLVINSLMQISNNPIVCVISVNNKSYTKDLIEQSGLIGITVLSNDINPEIYEIFGYKSGINFDKFKYFKHTLEYDVPILNDNAGFFCGRIINKINILTHTLFFFEVKKLGGNVTNIPITYDNYQKNIKKAH